MLATAGVRRLRSSVNDTQGAPLIDRLRSRRRARPGPASHRWCRRTGRPRGTSPNSASRPCRKTWWAGRSQTNSRLPPPMVRQRPRNPPRAATPLTALGHQIRSTSSPASRNGSQPAQSATRVFLYSGWIALARSLRRRRGSGRPGQIHGGPVISSGCRRPEVDGVIKPAGRSARSRRSSYSATSLRPGREEQTRRRRRRWFESTRIRLKDPSTQSSPVRVCAPGTGSTQSPGKRDYGW